MRKIKTVNMRDKIEVILNRMAKGEDEPDETIDSLLSLLKKKRKRMNANIGINPVSMGFYKVLAAFIRN